MIETLYPLLTSHEHVYLERGDKNRDSVPVPLANEIKVEFPGPRIRYVLFFIMLRANREVNVMADFVEQHMSKSNIP